MTDSSPLDRIEAAEKAATAGPWRYYSNYPAWVEPGHRVTGSIYADGGEQPIVWKPNHVDAALIALLRNHAAELVAVAKVANAFRFGNANVYDLTNALEPLLKEQP